MVITITASDTTGKVNVPVHATVGITSTNTIKNIEWRCNKSVNYSVSLDNKTLNFTPSADGIYIFTISVTDGITAVSKTLTVTVGDTASPPTPPAPTPEPSPEPTPQPTPGTGTVLYDSTIHSKLHDGKVRTVTTEGNIECRASGDPRIVVNADGTFSLVCDAGHGRFYLYVNNYNSVMEIEAAFWKSAPGQDLSLRSRSRHNEGGAEDNRFGGYGFTPDPTGSWGSKTEQFHNEHSESVDGNLPSKPVTGQYFKVEHSIKDEGSAVRQIAKYNGTQVLSRTVKKYQDKPLFDTKSYFWVRSNIDSGTGEVRIKRLRILAL